MPERVMGNHPAIIRPDNGPEFISTALGRWDYGRGIELEFIRPGKPMGNGTAKASTPDYGKNI